MRGRRVQLRLLLRRGDGSVLELRLRLLNLLVLGLLGLGLWRRCRSRSLRRRLLSARGCGCTSLRLGLRTRGVLRAGLGLGLRLGSLTGVLLALAGSLRLHGRGGDLRLLCLQVLKLLGCHLHRLAWGIALDEVLVLGLGLGLVMLHGHLLSHQSLNHIHVSTRYRKDIRYSSSSSIRT